MQPAAFPLRAGTYCARACAPTDAQEFLLVGTSAAIVLSSTSAADERSLLQP